LCSRFWSWAKDRSGYSEAPLPHRRENYLRLSTSTQSWIFLRGSITNSQKTPAPSTIATSGIRIASMTCAPKEAPRILRMSALNTPMPTALRNQSRSLQDRTVLTDGTGYRLLNGDFGTSPSCWQLPKERWTPPWIYASSRDALFSCIATAKKRACAAEGIFANLSA
jgi:hypothetical protein